MALITDVCACVLIGPGAWMPITDCFMEVALVFKHHEQLMASLFTQLETLFQLLFRLLGTEKKQEKHPVALAD